MVSRAINVYRITGGELEVLRMIGETVCLLVAVGTALLGLSLVSYVLLGPTGQWIFLVLVVAAVLFFFAAFVIQQGIRNTIGTIYGESNLPSEEDGLKHGTSQG